MEIKDIQGNILIDVPITESAVKTDELMKQYSITLSWSAIADDELPLGSYIEYDGIRYSLLAPYKPQQKDEAEYEYKPVFEHPVMRWQYLPFLFYTYSGDKLVSKEPDWSLTDNAANFMSAVCDAIKQQTGESWTYEIADNLPASASLSFNNTDIFSALGSIASQFETEWWFDYAEKVIYLSKASYGNAVTLEVGQNIGIPSVNQSKNGYYTRFLVFGSTRNIEQNYQGSNTNSIVNRRLTLNPAKYPDGYIDIRQGLSNDEILSKTIVFDDIYPRSMLTISNVKVRLMWRLDSDNQKVQIGTDADGKPVYDQYAIWYFKIPALSFNKDMVISGKVLSVHFNDGPLQGREFELTYHDVAKDVETSDGTSIRVDAGDFEINFIEEGTYIIPAMTGLVPVDGNSVSLFNIVMPEEYKASAYEELEKAALKEIAKQGEDMSNYSFSSNAVEFFMSNPALKVGRKVTYKNGDYTYSTRVIKLETQLDRPYEQKITIGNEQIKGNTQTLKEEVVSANQNIDLISAINESTQQLMQSYQRTQKALLDSMSKWGNMWRLDAENNAVYTPLNMIVEGTLAMGRLGEGGGETPVAGLQKVSITIQNYDNPFVSDAFGNVTLPAYPTALKNPYALIINGVHYDGSKEVTINLEGGGGIADSVAWENVLGRPTALSEFENDLEFITYATLNGYATQSWVGDNYLSKSGGEISNSNWGTTLTLNGDGTDAGLKFTNSKNFRGLLYTNTYGRLGWYDMNGVDNTIIHSGNIDSHNAGSATKLQTARTIWGQSFDGSGDISAAPSFPSYLDVNRNADTGALLDSSKMGFEIETYANDARFKTYTPSGSNTSHLVLSYAGNVLIGDTTDSGSKLSIYANGASGRIKIYSSGTEGLNIGQWDGVTNRFESYGRPMLFTAYDSKPIMFGFIGDGNALTLNPNGNILVGTTTDSGYKLDVNGSIRGTSLKIGDAELVWDSTNQALKIVGNAYVTKAFSMGELTESGSGGGGAAGIVTVRVNGYDYNSVNGIVTLPDYPTSLPASDVYSWAKAATKPTYTASEVGALSTSGGTIDGDLVVENTLRVKNYLKIVAWPGYGEGNTDMWYNGNTATIHSAASHIELNGNIVLHSGNYSSYTLPLSGGTLTGNLALSNSYLQLWADSKLYGYNVSGSSGEPIYLKNDAWYTLYHTGNFNPSNYLPLSGGTIVSDSFMPLILDSNNNQSRLNFRVGGADKALVGWNPTYGAWLYSYPSGAYLHIKDDGTPCYNGNTLIHSGNIGSQSVNYASSAGNADTLDGYHADSFVKSYIDSTDNFTRFTNRAFFQTAWISGQGDFGTLVIPTWTGNNTGTYYTTELRFNIHSTNPKIRITSPDGTSDWYTLARTVDNVASATKLQTARYIFGQLFDGTQNISGVLSDVNQVTFDVNKSYGIFRGDWIHSNLQREDLGYYAPKHFFLGSILVNTTTDNGYKLDVAGNARLMYVVTEFNDEINRYGGTLYLQHRGSIAGSQGDTKTGGIAMCANGGYVGIGTANPTEKLTVSGNTMIFGNLTTTGDIISEGTMAMAKLASSSDRKLKDNIAEVSAEQSMSIVRQLRPTTWNWKKDGKKSYGFIAQEVEPIVPEMVVNMEHLHLEYNQLHAFEIGAIKHIDSEVEILKRRVNELENELKQYRRNA